MKTVERLPPITKRTEPCPDHLRPETAAWWSSVVGEWKLERHHIMLLTAAAESWDRMTMAREALAAHGMTSTDARGVVRARPEVLIERDAKTSFRQLLRELDLDLEAPASHDGLRPPALRSNRGGF